MDKIAFEQVDNTVASFLSRLWRVVIVSNGYTPFLIPLLNAHMEREFTKMTLSNTKVATNKNNDMKRMTSNTMTWTTLVFLIKHILAIKECSMTIEVTKDSKVVEHKIDNIDADSLYIVWSKTREQYGDIDKMMDDYINRTKDIPAAVKKTNLRKKVNTKAMSWKNFIFLYSKVIEADKLVLTLDVSHSDGDATTHTLQYIMKEQTNEK